MPVDMFGMGRAAAEQTRAQARSIMKEHPEDPAVQRLGGSVVARCDALLRHRAMSPAWAAASSGYVSAASDAADLFAMHEFLCREALVANTLSLLRDVVDVHAHRPPADLGRIAAIDADVRRDCDAYLAAPDWRASIKPHDAVAGRMRELGRLDRRLRARDARGASDGGSSEGGGSSEEA